MIFINKFYKEHGYREKNVILRRRFIKGSTTLTGYFCNESKNFMVSGAGYFC